MLRTKNLVETVGIHAFTDNGDFFGEVEDAIITNNKVDSWKIKASKGSFLSKALAGAKGVIVPHQLVKAIGDVMIVSKAAAPSYTEDEAGD
jgi:sporulation protein YlmC with PRC-barrel domain